MIKYPMTCREKAFYLLEKARNIVVFTGAGISTGCGLPDFRGPGGLYETVGKTYGLPYPEAIFDINYFHENPAPFFDLSRQLLSRSTEPTACHRLVARGERAGSVSLVVTQNIDLLHQRAGTRNLLSCHGSYDRARCLSCGKSFTFDEYREDLFSGKIPRCSCGGVIKPDVVFFGESLPDSFYSLLRRPFSGDFILILGTSLQVQPAAAFALAAAESVPSLLVNKEKTPYDSLMDVVLHEDLDDFACSLKNLWTV